KPGTTLGSGEGRCVRLVVSLQPIAELVAYGRALVRDGRAPEEGGRRRQAGRPGGGGPGGAAGDTAGAAVVRAPVRARESRDRVGAAVAAPPRAQTRARAT